MSLSMAYSQTNQLATSSKQDQILTGKGRRISDMLIMTHMAHNSQAHLYTFGLFIKVAECNDYISHVDYGITREQHHTCPSPRTPIPPGPFGKFTQ